MKSKGIHTLVAAFAFGLCQAHSASANAIYNVSLDTAAFTGPLSVYFQLLDGAEAAGEANNTVVLDQFAFGGGAAAGSPVFFGGAYGTLESGLVLSDSDFFTLVQQDFAPGGVLSFRLNVTTVLNAGPTPDSFAFSLFDASGAVAGSDPLSGALLTIDLMPSPGITNYGVSLTSVPEPGTLALLSIGLLGAIGRKPFHRRFTDRR